MDCTELFEKVRQASRGMVFLTEDKINSILRDVADTIVSRTDEILVANNKDLARMDKANPVYDRLQLTEQRIADIASSSRRIAKEDGSANRKCAAGKNFDPVRPVAALHVASAAVECAADLQKPAFGHLDEIVARAVRPEYAGRFDSHGRI